MAKSNATYWKERFEALEDTQYRKSKEYYQDVEKQFRMATNNVQMDIEKWYARLAENNDISYAAAKRLLKKKELEEFHWTLEEYIKKGQENAVNQRWMKELENASARVHIERLEAMKIQMQQHAELLSAQYLNGTTNFLRNTYADNFYRTAYEIQKGIGIGSNLTKLDTRTIDKIIQQPWASDGANFSDRIWSNKEKLVHNLHTELTQSIIRGENPSKAAERLAKIMGVSKAQAENLVMTESAAISSAATKDSLNELGVEQYEILATLDNRTSDICQSLDGKVFEMKDYKIGLTAPPFHPRCRTTTVPYFHDEFTEGDMRAARGEDGKTYYVPADMKYQEWKEKFVDKGKTGSKNDIPKYLMRNNKKGENITQLRLAVNKVISEMPSKIQEAIQSGTIVDIGKLGASQYDYNNDILYIANGAGKEEIIHEIGHMVENKMLNTHKVEQLKESILKTVSPKDIITETYYDANNNPVDIFIIKNDKFVTEYQGRLYVDDWSEIYDENWNIRPEHLQEFMSEPFKEFMMNPQEFKHKYPIYYEIIKEAIE